MRVVLLAVCTLTVVGCAGMNVAVVPALRETAAVSAIGDAADDPAIWVARDAAASRVIATQKKGGVYVFDLAGRVVQEISGGLPNNIDLRPGFAWDGGAAPIVGASDRSDNAIVFWRLDEESGRMDAVPRARIATGFAEVYGFCLGRRGNDFIAVATSKTGQVGLWRLAADGKGGIAGERIGGFDLGSISEGCVVDDALGVFYVAQENVGIWRAELPDVSKRHLIDRVGDGRLVADVEGLALYAAPDGGGFLIASVQGESRYAVYRRDGTNAYVGSFAIGPSRDGSADAVSGTDGIDVTATPLGPDFPQGLLVVQDDENTAPAGLQDFKFISWADAIAALKP